jgi:hypothetical protein
MKANPETCRVHYFQYLRFYFRKQFDNNKLLHSTPAKPQENTSQNRSDTYDRVSLNLSDNSLDVVENGKFSIREMGDGSETLSINQTQCDNVSESSMTNHEEDRVMDEVDSSTEATQIEQGTTQTHKEKPPDLGLKIGINRENSILR